MTKRIFLFWCYDKRQGYIIHLQEKYYPGKVSAICSSYVINHDALFVMVFEFCFLCFI